jgi:ABC-type lipoprotein export system ATPase subunit
MQRITLHKVLPQIFAESKDAVKSQIWLNEVQFEKGKSYLIEASSGKGKSSLFSYLLGYRNDYQGTVLFDEANVNTFSMAKWSSLRREQIAVLYQDLKLFPELTSWDNILLKNKLTNYLSVAEIEAYLEMLGIADKQHVKVEKMSFGQRQRLALVRSLAQPCDFLLLDEPISHLDEQNAQIMSKIVAARMRSEGMGVIVSSIGQTLPLAYDAVFEL